MLPNPHCLFPFRTHKASTPAHSLEGQLSALSILFYKSPVLFIAFIYCICKIYFSNDKFLFWAWSLKNNYCQAVGKIFVRYDCWLNCKDLWVRLAV